MATFTEPFVQKVVVQIPESFRLHNGLLSGNGCEVSLPEVRRLQGARMPAQSPAYRGSPSLLPTALAVCALAQLGELDFTSSNTLLWAEGVFAK